MTTPQVAASTPVATVAPRHAGKRRTRGGPGGQAAPAASRDAVKAVAVILQVLGGALTPEHTSLPPAGWEPPERATHRRRRARQ